MANEVREVQVTLNQAMLQTIRMGLSAIQLAAVQVEAHLNEAVQAALTPPPPPDDEESVESQAPNAPTKLRGGLGSGRP